MNRRRRCIRWCRSRRRASRRCRRLGLSSRALPGGQPRAAVPTFVFTMTGKESGHIDHEAAQAVPHANPETLEVAPGTAHEKLEGWIPQLATEEEIRVA